MSKKNTTSNKRHILYFTSGVIFSLLPFQIMYNHLMFFHNKLNMFPGLAKTTQYVINETTGYHQQQLEKNLEAYLQAQKKESVSYEKLQQEKKKLMDEYHTSVKLLPNLVKKLQLNSEALLSNTLYTYNKETYKTYKENTEKDGFLNWVYDFARKNSKAKDKEKYEKLLQDKLELQKQYATSTQDLQLLHNIIKEQILYKIIQDHIKENPELEEIRTYANEVKRTLKQINLQENLTMYKNKIRQQIFSTTTTLDKYEDEYKTLKRQSNHQRAYYNYAVYQTYMHPSALPSYIDISIAALCFIGAYRRRRKQLQIKQNNINK